jgi:hypothetical protein
MPLKVDLPSLGLTFVIYMTCIYIVYLLYTQPSTFPPTDLTSGLMLISAGVLFMLAVIMTFGCYAKYMSWSKDDIETMAPKQ